MNSLDSQGLLAELAAFSARIGRDRTLIQGAGGNTSRKIAGTLFVKASGTWLAEAETSNLFTPVPLDLLAAEILRTRSTGDELDPEAMGAAKDARPSIETVLHGILRKAVVVHVHSVNVIAHAVRDDGREAVAGKLAGLDWAWIGYARPGRRLAHLIEAAPEADIYVLANHGLIIQADTVDEAQRLLDEVEARLQVTPRPVPTPQWDALGAIAAATGMQVPEDPDVHAAALDEAWTLASAGALYPDHVVYLGGGPVVSAPPAATQERLESLKSQTGQRPTYMVVPGAGVLLSPDANRCVAPMLDCLGMVLRRLEAPDRIVFLSESDEFDLTQWDQERHRMRLAAQR